MGGCHGGADDGEGSRGGGGGIVVVGGGVDGDGGEDDVGDVVGCVDDFYGACEGGEVCDLDVGEESIQEKRLSVLFPLLIVARCASRHKCR